VVVILILIAAVLILAALVLFLHGGRERRREEDETEIPPIIPVSAEPTALRKITITPAVPAATQPLRKVPLTDREVDGYLRLMSERAEENRGELRRRARRLGTDE
jgi:hypothetical protein